MEKECTLSLPAALGVISLAKGSPYQNKHRWIIPLREKLSYSSHFLVPRKVPSTWQTFEKCLM